METYTGLECFDADGKKIFDSDDLMTFKYLGKVEVTYSGQSITDERLANRTPFAFPVFLRNITSGNARGRDAWAETNGTVMTFYFSDVVSATFIYGVL